MNYKKIIGAVALAGLSLFPAAAASATGDSWGPQDRATYTWESPSDHRVFNSITDNPEIGNERNFVRVRELNDNNSAHTDTAEVHAGKEYEVYIYYHNNAGANYNASGAGIANNVRLSTSLPEKIEQNQLGIVKATITATNTEPTSVWDTAYLHAQETVYMSYVWDSATLHNTGKLNGSILDAQALFSENGVKIGYNEWGIVPGCNEYAGYVTYRVLASAEPTPETPPTTTTTTPSEMPDTGPGEIILASVVAIAIIGGVIYYIRTKKAIKHIKK